MPARTVRSFGTGFAVLVPAWTVPMIVRTGGWLPVLGLVVAVVWLRMARGDLPGARRAGLAAGVALTAALTTPVVAALLVVVAVPPRRGTTLAELPPAAADEARRVRRLFRLATSGTVAIEIRAYGLESFLVAAHDRASAVVLRERRAVAYRLLRCDLLAGLAVSVAVAAMVAAALWAHADGTAVFAAAWAAAVVVGGAFD